MYLFTLVIVNNIQIVSHADNFLNDKNKVRRTNIYPKESYN